VVVLEAKDKEKVGGIAQLVWWLAYGLYNRGSFVCSLFNDVFQYLRLYSVDIYSVLIRLPSSSEAGKTRVRNMAAEFCRRAPIVLVGFFYMP
jgi:hypothetical protein